MSTEITNSEQAYAYARERGFIYSRARIGYGVYKQRVPGGQTLEIGHDCAKLYRAPGVTRGFDKSKTDRLIEVFRYVPAKGHGFDDAAEQVIRDSFAPEVP